MMDIPITTVFYDLRSKSQQVRMAHLNITWLNVFGFRRPKRKTPQWVAPPGPATPLSPCNTWATFQAKVLSIIQRIFPNVIIVLQWASFHILNGSYPCDQISEDHVTSLKGSRKFEDRSLTCQKRTK